MPPRHYVAWSLAALSFVGLMLILVGFPLVGVVYVISAITWLTAGVTIGKQLAFAEVARRFANEIEDSR